MCHIISSIDSFLIIHDILIDEPQLYILNLLSKPKNIEFTSEFSFIGDLVWLQLFVLILGCEPWIIYFDFICRCLDLPHSWCHIHRLLWRLVLCQQSLCLIPLARSMSCTCLVKIRLAVKVVHCTLLFKLVEMAYFYHAYFDISSL